MGQKLFDWLGQDAPPEGFDGYQFPEAGDVRSPKDGNPFSTDLPYWQESKPTTRDIQPAPEGNYDTEGRLRLPDVDDSVYRGYAPDPNVTGKESEIDTWDYSYELAPVYAVPEELGGGEWTGNLQMAPSLAVYQPKILRYVKVPRSNKVA
jgi:hypothetical protein